MRSAHFEFFRRGIGPQVSDPSGGENNNRKGNFQRKNGDKCQGRHRPQNAVF